MLGTTKMLGALVQRIGQPAVLGELVADGRVPLEGEAGVLQEHEDAKRAAVQNRIAAHLPQVMPERMHAVIDNALERCAERIQGQRAMAW
jgi:hypothetical protein